MGPPHGQRQAPPGNQHPAHLAERQRRVRGAEIFAERWTPIIVRNLLVGCQTFGEIL